MIQTVFFVCSQTNLDSYKTTGSSTIRQWKIRTKKRGQNPEFVFEVFDYLTTKYTSKAHAEAA